jgi:RNA polymerase sigma-70 factor (ECF subfamily)
MAFNTYSFDLIYRDYYNSLLKSVMFKIRNRQTAEDILQEAFIKIWVALPGYDPEKGSIYAWMVTICAHVALDLLRSKAYRTEMITDQLDPQVAHVDMQYRCLINTDSSDLRCCLKELPIPFEEVLLLYSIGYTHREIGVMLHLPLGTVKSRIRAGLLSMRKRWI